jgi:tetratricopeptide (TPR) repeat protein
VGIIFSRVYGESAGRTSSLIRWRLKASVVSTVLVGLTVSGFALSDLSANALMYAGIQQLQMGNNYAAEALLSRSLRYDFAPRQTYYHLATAQLRLDRFDEAWNNLELCITRFLDEGVYLTYANLAANRGELEKAQRAVDILLGGRPLDTVEQQARYLEAVIAVQGKHYDRAVQLLESLAQDQPSYETAFIALGDIYAAQGLENSAQRNFETALRLIDRKLEDSTRRVEAGTFASVAEYGQLRSQVDLLTQQRELVLKRLTPTP